MRSRFKLALVLLVVGAAGCPPDPSKAAPDKIYPLICAKCHGVDGRGEPAIRAEHATLPDFTSPEFQAKYDADGVRKVIVAGNPNKGMPQFRDFTPAQLDALVARVKGFGSP